MGISNVAIKTFNSTGSQSVCRANKFKDDTLIESEFLTKCNTKYINGTGQTVVIGSMIVVSHIKCYIMQLMIS